MRQAGDERHGHRVNALIVVLWRAGLRINEASPWSRVILISAAALFWSAMGRTIAGGRSGWTRGDGPTAPCARRRVVARGDRAAADPELVSLILLHCCPSLSNAPTLSRPGRCCSWRRQSFTDDRPRRRRYPGFNRMATLMLGLAPAVSQRPPDCCNPPTLQQSTRVGRDHCPQGRPHLPHRVEGGARAPHRDRRRAKRWPGDAVSREVQASSTRSATERSPLSAWARS
jgi:hypothetical protein